MSVIMLGAIGLVLMVSVVYQSTITSKTNLNLQQASQARMLANTCAEEALQLLADTGVATASGNLSLYGGSCSYAIFMENGTVIVTAIGTSGTSLKRVKIIVSSLAPSVVLSSWQEVSSF